LLSDCCVCLARSRRKPDLSFVKNWAADLLNFGTSYEGWKRLIHEDVWRAMEATLPGGFSQIQSSGKVSFAGQSMSQLLRFLRNVLAHAADGEGVARACLSHMGAPPGKRGDQTLIVVRCAHPAVRCLPACAAGSQTKIV
jgi:hypothetical protein